MNKPYSFNYQAPVNPWWEGNAAAIASSSGDLENLLKQARGDANSLGETVARLDGELRTARIDKVVAEKKIEALAKLIDEVSVLRRNESVATVQSGAQTTHKTENPKLKCKSRSRKFKIFLPIVAVLILAGVALFVFAANNDPWSTMVMNHIASWLHPVANRFFHFH